MTRLRFLACSFALAASASSALAADLPSRYAPAPYYDAAPIFTWGGVYAGINGQLGVGSFTQGGNQVFGSPLGGLGGATLGYNYQQGRSWSAPRPTPSSARSRARAISVVPPAARA